MIDLEFDESHDSQGTRTDWSRLARGALETVAIIGGFCAAGLSWAAIGGNSGSGRPELRDASVRTLYAVGVIDEFPPSSRVVAATPPNAGSRTAAPAQTTAPAHSAAQSPAQSPAQSLTHSQAQTQAQTPAETRPSIWLVDGFNVLHVGLLGGRDRSKWWTEAKRQELLERVESFDDSEAELWIVFDGQRDAPGSRDGVRTRCLFAPSADAWLVERVREADDPSQLAVVTADRQVAGRSRSRGAQVVSPRDFLARCPV